MILMGFLVLYFLYLLCCTDWRDNEEEKEVVAPEQHIVEQGGVVKVLSLPRVWYLFCVFYIKIKIYIFKIFW